MSTITTPLKRDAIAVYHKCLFIEEQDVKTETKLLVVVVIRTNLNI